MSSNVEPFVPVGRFNWDEEAEFTPKGEIKWDNPSLDQSPMALFDEALAREEQETNFTAEEVDFLEQQEGGEKEVLEATGEKTSEGRPIYKNQWGDFVTERTITEYIPSLGGVYNIPTVVDGRFLEAGEAIQLVINAGGKDPITGRQLTKFLTIGDAVESARRRSKDVLGKELEQLVKPQQATFDQAMFWADRYNADASIPLSERIRMFKDKQDVEVLPSVTSAIVKAVGSGAFSKEMESRGLDKDTVIAALENISKVETSGGRNNEISSGMAGGILQVIPSTFKDLLDRGIIGPKALKAIGRTKEELLKMSDREKAEFLQSDDDAAAMFGLGAFLNKMERSDGS